MSTLSVSDVRQRVAAALEAVPTWAESRWGLDLLGRDPKFTGNRLFAVGVSDTSVSPSAQRQKRSEGALVESIVQIRWLWQLRLDDQIASMDEALDGEHSLIVALAGISLDDLHLIFQRAERRVTPEGWVVGTLQHSARHRINLQ